SRPHPVRHLPRGDGMTTTDQFPLPSSPTADATVRYDDDNATSDLQTQAAWRIVAGREIMVKLRDKNFIISTLTTLGIMVVAFAASFLLSGQTESKTLAV